MTNKYHALMIAIVFIGAIIAGGIGYYVVKDLTHSKIFGGNQNLKVPHKDPHYFTCACKIQFKNGGSAWINNLITGRAESIVYQGQEISAIYIYPVLYFTYKGDLVQYKTSAEVFINISVGTNANQPLDSYQYYLHTFTFNATPAGLEILKDGKATWHLGDLELKESQLEEILAQTVGSSYTGPVYINFMVNVVVHATFADGGHASRMYSGSGVLSGLSIDPDGSLGTGSVIVKFNWQETDSPGGAPGSGNGGNKWGPHPYDVLG